MINREDLKFRFKTSMLSDNFNYSDICILFKEIVTD